MLHARMKGPLLHASTPLRALGVLCLGFTTTVAWAQSTEDKRDTGHAPAPSQTLYANVCAACHGTRGEGNAGLKAPSIAGLPDWYARRQLENFRQDRRGVHPQDVEGQMMRAVSKVLTDDQVSTMAGHLATLPRVTPVVTVEASTVAGKELFAERCMECHRYNAEGELFFGSPPLVGLQDWYLMAQLRKYQQGMRGANTGDEYAQKMVFSSQFVESEEMLRSLVAYLVEMQQPKPSESAPPNPTSRAAGSKPDPFEEAATKKAASQQAPGH